MLRQINRLWRILATGLCFVIFGLGGILMATLVFPYIALISSTEEIRRTRAQACICWVFGRFVSIMQVLGVITFSSRGIRELQGGNGEILVANHPSLIDIVLLGSLLRQFDCIVKEALWHNPFLGRVVKAAGFIPNTRGGKLVRACEQRLAKGGKLIVFPEGTRSKPDQEIKLQRGAAQISLRTGYPIRLVHISCSPLTLSKGEKWYQSPAVRPHFAIVVGAVIDPHDILIKYKELPKSARHLTEHIKSEFENSVDRNLNIGNNYTLLTTE
ncbi:MAG: 1-acyl-sn-glycerol-3-phosphate acyltransferase [Gammaproteobacteria bacterium]|nr:1-acyl-sn-glycerol-3-phosphate acyltransferase [Gammaproteobacteria bacterium]